MRRVVAFAVDCLAFIPVNIVLQWTFGPWSGAILSPLFLGYLIAGDLGPQTIGRRAAGVRVTNCDDRRFVALAGCGEKIADLRLHHQRFGTLVHRRLPETARATAAVREGDG